MKPLCRISILLNQEGVVMAIKRSYLEIFPQKNRK